MHAAVHPFAEALADVDLDDGSTAVISCATVRPFRDVHTELAAALIKPVRWRETMIELVARGISTFIDAGPGAVLAKLAPRCVPGVVATPLNNLLETPHPALA
jgi:[acyl-carrier-protein] S-malonyltransferase